MPECLIIRADASTHIGTGHVMRCLALTQEWMRSGGSAIFAFAEMTDALETRLAGEGFQSTRLAVIPGTSEDATRTAELAMSQNASWVVADGYHFGLNFQQVIKAAGLRLLLLDDYGHAEEYVADLVLNQNVGANASLYSKSTPYTRLLLGTRYALLREGFFRWREWKREIPAVARKVLVTLGGSDPDNVTGKVIQALADFQDLEIMVVVGGSNPHLQDLQSKIKNHKAKINLVVNAANMPELMAWADVTVAAGGSTCWELAMMGMPMLLVILADNQQGIATALAATGAAINLGWHHTIQEETVTHTLMALLRDPARRQSMSLCGRSLVDGHGAVRVSKHLTQL